jgi:bacterial/archaeal transporter family-2 protein
MSWQSLMLFGLPLLAGALIPIQTGANRMVAVRLENPLVAAGASMAIAAVVLIAIGVSSLRQGAVHAALSSLPIWSWAGGLLGAFFVTGAIVIAPRIGATSYLLLVFVGQMTMAVMTDRLGLFGFDQRAVTPIQIVGLIGTMLSATLALGSFRP